MSASVERELVDLLGGSSGGWAFWTAALSALELAIAASRGREDAFCSYPPGELRRFLRDVRDALGLAATAVTVQELVNGDEPEHRERVEQIDRLLLERARETG